MNYRHAFHAGNHGDVLKHAVLALVLERLAAKPKPFFVLDTHAGRGRYDLHAAEAVRSPEFQCGVGRLFDAQTGRPLPGAPGALRPYLDAVVAENPFGAMRWYPGSPLLIQRALRKGDRAILCELAAAEASALDHALGQDARVETRKTDGYAAVKALLPPLERRGLVVIDPPFEAPDEHQRLAAGLGHGLARWASGVFMVWLPLKDAAAHEMFSAAVRDLAPPKILVAELQVAGPAPGKFIGSSLSIINPPFGLAGAIVDMMPYLVKQMAMAPEAGWRVIEREHGALVVQAEGVVAA